MILRIFFIIWLLKELLVNYLTKLSGATTITTYAYDANDRLTSEKVGSTVTASYTYDATQLTGVIVQRLFHPHKTRSKMVKPMKIDTHFYGMKQPKT